MSATRCWTRRAYSVLARSAAWRAATGRPRASSARICAALSALAWSFSSVCMRDPPVVTALSGRGPERDLRPYARAGSAVDAPARRHLLHDVQAEAAAPLQVRPPPRDRPGAAVVFDLQPHHVEGDASADRDDRIGGAVGGAAPRGCGTARGAVRLWVHA